MDLFDQSLQFQFVMFFDTLEPEGTLIEELQQRAARLPEVLGGPKSAIGLRLKAPAAGVAGVPPFNVLPGLQWNAGMWKVTWNPGRMDLTFNALGYAELVTSELTVESVANSLAPSLTRVPALLEMKAIRISLVATGERSEKEPSAPKTLARRFASPRLQRPADEGSLADLLIRSNRKTTWKLDQRDVEINRLETVNAAQGWQAPLPNQNFFSWQFDVNTDARQIEAISEQGVREFYNLAAKEISGASKELEDDFR